MELNHNYVTVDNPNPVPTTKPAVPLGQFTDVIGGCAPRDPADVFTANLSLSDMYLPNTTVRVLKGHFDHNAVFFNQHCEGAHLIGSCLFLEGTVRTTLLKSETGESVELRKGLQSMKYDPHNELAHWCQAKTPFHIVHFSIDPSYFMAMLPVGERWSDDVREHISMRKRFFGQMPTSITMPQYGGLQTIFNCPLPGQLGLLMMETSIVQILLYQMHAQFQQQQYNQILKVAKRDASIMEAVREHIGKTFLEDHSLESLARHFCTNTNKLMQLYKKMYGVSIFENIADLRMEHARQLLSEGMFVNEVSRSVGYKNAHHFSTAFKKKFGTSPSQWKC